MHRPPKTRQLSLTVALLGTATLAASGCREAATALGPTSAAVRANADQLIGAIAARFGPLELDPAYRTARSKLASGALVPSRVYNDTSLWTRSDAATRTFQSAGQPAGNRYQLRPHADAPPPSRPGTYRSTLNLRRAGDGEYSWDRRDELAIGTVNARDLDAALTALFSAAESKSEASVRTSYQRELPRTTASLARLFALDSIRLIHRPDRTTLVTIGVTVHPSRLTNIFPNYAKYLARYVPPVRYVIAAHDSTGAQWWEARALRSHLTFRFRVRGGSLAPLEGAPRRIPSTLQVRGEFFAKVGAFTVGMRGLVGDVTLTRVEHEKGFTARFRREPDWQLPPLVKQLIRSPLRRPFEGEGALIRYAVRDSAGAQTLAVRDYGVAVKESAILRFFNRLGNTAVGEFRAGAEREADQFTADVLRALRADVLALVPATATQ